MKRAQIAVVVTATLVAWSASSVKADVKADEKNHVEFAGVLGKMVNFFGGKSAREGVTSTIAVKGNRKATISDTTEQIIDLGEEKVYDIDLHKKTYKVTTFDELRRRMQEAEQKAEENAAKETSHQAAPPEQPKEKPKEIQVDVDVKNTGEAKVINGFNTKQVVTTISMHEKGKALDESGGMVVTVDAWLGPKIPALKDIQEFDRRYAQQLRGSTVAGASAEQAAAAAAMYPMLKDALGHVRTEGEKLDGTPIQQTVTMDVVKSAEQMAEEKKQQSDEDTSVKPSGGIGGMLGGFAKKAAKKKTEGDSGPHQRGTIMTMNNEVLKVATDVSADDLAIPAGFKESK